ncbi:unnamed protein product [Prorocentrum cordatum]|uniref:Secreted peptide n=1 Tax=Prorocentrum cordatum TaxID=2364126 RepID=A0ABN9SGV0_9DINO|nr:unnamed protein product [Polarella glacialis]
MFEEQLVTSLLVSWLLPWILLLLAATAPGFKSATSLITSRRRLCRCSLKRLSLASAAGTVIQIWCACLRTSFRRGLIFIDGFLHPSGATTIDIHRAVSCTCLQHRGLQPWVAIVLLINALVTASSVVPMVSHIAHGR